MAERYRRIAEMAGAAYHEIYLRLPKQEAIDRLYERGTWGERGSPKLTDDDLPKISALFDTMDRTSRTRQGHTEIEPEPGSLEETYRKILDALEA